MDTTQLKEKHMARIRSPNYPQVELQDAVDLVRTIFGKEGQNFTPREVVAELLGYSSVNGASEKKMSAITAYGLLDRNSERELRVSDLAMKILHPENEQEEIGALAEAALSPNLFQEIHEKWPDTLPSDASLRSYLIRRGFNQNAVDQVIAVFRNTMNLVNVENEVHDSPDEGVGTDAGSERLKPEATMQAQPTQQNTNKPIVFDMETISGQYSFDNADDLAHFIEKLEKIRPLLPDKD
jgi:hypothetical protein